MSLQTPRFDRPLAWQVESLRLTGFLKTADSQPVSGQWESLTGVAPDEQIIRPKQAEVEESGQYGDGRLSFKLSGGRYDWLFHVEPAVGELLEQIPTVGFLEEVLPLFKNLMTKWLIESPTISRIAFGAVLMIPVRDRVHGYEVVSTFLPFQVDGARFTDFSFQINDPKEFELDGIGSLRINRLTKWAVARAFSMRFQIIPNATFSSQMREELYAVRLELDVNTSPEFEGEFRDAFLLAVFDLLMQTAVDVAQEGVH